MEISFVDFADTAHGLIIKRLWSMWNALKGTQIAEESHILILGLQVDTGHQYAARVLLLRRLSFHSNEISVASSPRLLVPDCEQNLTRKDMAIRKPQQDMYRILRGE